VNPEIVAVLVVPAEGDPGGLLAAGVCDFGAPTASLIHTTPEPDQPGEWYSKRFVGAFTYALPLWWDGALCPEGWDRARRVYSVGRREIDDHYGTAEIMNPDWFVVSSFAEQLVRVGLASRVVRLARVDGRLVEVTP
jgi:hypothetical protein